MSTPDFSNQEIVSIYKAQLRDALKTPFALALAAVERDKGSPSLERVENMISDAIGSLWTEWDSASQRNVVDFRKPETRFESASPPYISGSASAQELIITTLRDGPASVQELQNNLEDHNIVVTPGNLSVILSRMAKSRTIERIGRGMYRYAG